MKPGDFVLVRDKNRLAPAVFLGPANAADSRFFGRPAFLVKKLRGGAFTKWPTPYPADRIEPMPLEHMDRLRLKRAMARICIISLEGAVE